MKNLRFVLLLMICLANIVSYMHFASIAIALISMCDHNCEPLLGDRDVMSQLENNSLMANSTGIFVQVQHDPSHSNLEYLALSGEIGSIGLAWLHVTEEEYLDNHHSNGSYITSCTWQQIRDCQRFKLNHTLKAFIFSASFWACLIFQIPSGIIINRIGGFWIFFLVTLFIGVFDFILPWAASVNEWLIVALRFIYGALSAASATAEYKLIDEWMMTCDKSISLALIIASQTLGKIIILAISGFLIEYFGWAAIFYVSSVASMVVAGLVLLTIRNKPSQVSWISEDELKSIELDHAEKMQVDPEGEFEYHSTPWKKVMTNMPFLSLTFLMFTSAWSFTVYTNELPLFLDQVSNIHITANGILNAATNVTRIIALLSSGYLSEKLISCGWLTRLSSRKLFSIVLAFGQSLCLLLVPFVTSNTTLLSILLLLATFASGMASGAVLPLHYELSVNYSVVLLSITDTIGNLTGIIVPIFASAVQVICSAHITLGWSIIFVFSALLISLSEIIFLLFIKSDRQPFDYIN